MKKNIFLRKVVIACIFFFTFANLSVIQVFAAEKGTRAVNYTITPNSKTYKNNFTNYSTYNSYTKHYYLLRSYLERLEKKGGGTLTLKAGTYTICNTLYVPSNVTIILKDGVVIEKGNKTGTSKLKPSKSIFQLVAPSKSKVKGAYGKYDGEKNIKFIGEGNATIDLKYSYESIGIVAGHNRYVTIDNINFKNMYSGHFIELDATYKAVITNSTFKKSKASPKLNKEAINLDTPDRTTEGWSQEWSKFDATPNKNISITNNKFYNLDRAIGTHKYSGGKLHKDVVIKNNTIDTIRKDAIGIMNWKDSVIENNIIKNVDKSEPNNRAIIGSGAINPTIKNNTIENAYRPMQFMPWKNEGPGSQYDITYNEITEENKSDFKTNKLEGVTEEFIRINTIYNVFDKGTEHVYFVDDSIKEFKVSPNSKPFGKKYTTNSNYNSYTKHYYLLRSYLEELENRGGGTLTLSKGTYNITTTLYVPSNVTIILNDGVVIKKTNKTGTAGLKSTNSMFQLISPKNSTKKGYAAKYNGEKNIKIIGKGSATIDLNNIGTARAIVAGHNNGLTIQGIKFTNLNDGNYIKLASSYNVKILKNTFTNGKATGSKEAINLATADNKTMDFNYVWSKKDKYVNKKVLIENNKFSNLDRAVGSFKYSESRYHKNITIKNNTIENIRKDAIRILNWKDTVIEGNTIKNVSAGTGTYRAILGSGAINPTIKNNNIEKVARPMQFMPAKNSGDGESYKITYNDISYDNIKGFKANKYSKLGENIIRINHTYNVFDKDTDKIDLSHKDITITPNTKPLNSKYLRASKYGKYTKHYYLIRSALEELERADGGILTLESGIYSISNTLYVPSNVTILLKDGVKLRKLKTTGFDSLSASRTMFQLVAPSRSKHKRTYSKYNGEKNIKIIGEGNATIDMRNMGHSVTFVLGHNKNVEIEGITFKNVYGGNYIRMVASRNVTIKNNKFLDRKAYKTSEAINNERAV